LPPAPNGAGEQKYIVGMKGGKQVYAAERCAAGTDEIFHREIARDYGLDWVKGGGRVQITKSGDSTLLQIYDSSGSYGRPSPETLKQLKEALEKKLRHRLPNLEVIVEG
jgi:hypothetical protein